MFEDISILIEKGGWVLWFIFLTLLSFWLLVLERYYFFKYTYPKEVEKKKNLWLKVQNKDSWFSQCIYQKIISEVSRDLKKYLPSIKTLIALFPLLGLLGTITGMISIFDIISLTGTGNA
ncbi:MAG: MotA/TolQ/ExbB proton channel family protein, partial [Bdellovibrionales bacterium]